MSGTHIRLVAGEEAEGIERKCDGMILFYEEFGVA